MHTAAIDVLLLKFRMTWSPSSSIEVSYCNLLETDLHLVSLFPPQCLFGLFFKSASQIVCL
jgi:hypothetical protein